MAAHRDIDQTQNLSKQVPIVPGLRPTIYRGRPSDAYVHDTGPVPSPDAYTEQFTPDHSLRSEEWSGERELYQVPRKGNDLMEAIGEAALLIYRVTLFVTCLALLLALWKANQVLDGLGDALQNISTNLGN